MERTETSTVVGQNTTAGAAAPAMWEREPCNFAVGYRQAVRDIATAVIIAFAVYTYFTVLFRGQS